MFFNPLFDNSTSPKPSNQESSGENFSFKPGNQATIEQARNSISNLMQKFEKPKKISKFNKNKDEILTPIEKIKEEKSGIINNINLLSESFMNDLEGSFNDKKEGSLNNENNESQIQKRMIIQAEEINKIKDEMNIRNNEIKKFIEKSNDDNDKLIKEIQRHQNVIQQLKDENLKQFNENIELTNKTNELLEEIHELNQEKEKEKLSFKKEIEKEKYLMQKEINEFKETIKLNEALLRKSVNKDVVIEQIQYQFEELQKERNKTESELKLLKEEINNKLNLIDKLEKEIDEINNNNNIVENNNKNLIKELDEKNQIIIDLNSNINKIESENQNQLKELINIKEKYENIIIENKANLEKINNYELKINEFQNIQRNLNNSLDEISKLKEEKSIIELELDKVSIKTTQLESNLQEINNILEQTLAENLNLKQNLSDIKNIETNYENLKKEFIILDEKHKKNKTMIDNYTKEMENYKIEKDLIIKQLLEEKQARASVTEQKRLYEENLKQYENESKQKELKIKELFDGLLDKESYIRNSINEKNKEIENVRTSLLNELDEHKKKEKDKQNLLFQTIEKYNYTSKMLENKEIDLKYYQDNYNKILKEKEISDKILIEKDSIIKELQSKLDEKNKFSNTEIQIKHGKYDYQTFTSNIPIIISGNNSNSKDVLNSVVPLSQNNNNFNFVNLTSNELNNNLNLFHDLNLNKNFIKRNEYKETQILKAVTYLQNEIFSFLEGYQKLLEAMKQKNKNNFDIKKYIGLDLENLFYSYIEILLNYFVINFLYLASLNITNIKKGKIKIMTKLQYLGLQEINLITEGPLEHEINGIMKKINEFIIEFYDYLIIKKNRVFLKKKNEYKKYLNTDQIEINCINCNSFISFNDYQNHVLSCKGKIYFDNIFQNSKENYLSDTITNYDKQKIINYLIEKIKDKLYLLKNEKIKEDIIIFTVNLKCYLDHNNNDLVKILKDLKFIVQNVEEFQFNVYFNRIYILLENKRIKYENEKIINVNNIDSD